MTVQTPTTTSVQDPPKSKSRNRPDFFVIRFLIVTVALLLIMSASNVNIGSIGQGLAYSLVGVSVYITFRILTFPDLTVDGAFPVGGAVCAAIIVAGGSAEVSLLAAFLVGALAGLATALITIFLKIDGLLSSIIVITGTYTVTLRV